MIRKYLVFAGGVLVVASAFGLWLTAAPASPQLSKLNPLKKSGAVEKLLKGDPPLTTGLSDAVTEVPFLDGFKPASFRSMVRLPRGDRQEFLMSQPGLYAYEARSFCLKAGAHGPGGRSALLYAPLKGKWAGIIDNIVVRSIDHPEIPQKDVQTLIWAVLAKTKIDKLPPRLMPAATALLTPREIKTVSGGAIGLIPDSVKREALSKLPPAARQVFEAEEKIRDMLGRGEDAFERIEEVAVLTGEAPPGEGSRDIPRGRWSFHPEGYFIRLMPHSYSETRVEVSYPAPAVVGRDSEGRIERISGPDGSRLEVSYDGAVTPMAFDRDPGLRGHAFKRVRYVQAITGETGYVFENDAVWENEGWTLAGVPAGSGGPRSTDARYGDAAARAAGAREHLRQMESLQKGLGLSRRPVPAEIMDLAHLSNAMDDLTGRDTERRSLLEREAARFVLSAWQDAVCRAFGEPGRTTALRRVPSGLLWAAQSGGRGSGGGAGASGNTSEQPVATAAGGDDPAEKPCNAGSVSGVQGDVSVNGESMGDGPRSFSAGDMITTGPHSRATISLSGGRTVMVGSNSNISMPDPCAESNGAPIGAMRVVQGHAYAVVSRIMGGDSTFRVNTGTCATGVRGAPEPLPRPQLFASLGPPAVDLSRLWRAMAGQGQWIPSVDKLEEAALVLEIEIDPEAKTLVLTAVKGPIKLFDSGGGRRVLNTGEVLRKSTDPARGKLKEIVAVMEPQ